MPMYNILSIASGSLFVTHCLSCKDYLLKTKSLSSHLGVLVNEIETVMLST